MPPLRENAGRRCVFYLTLVVSFAGCVPSSYAQTYRQDLEALLTARPERSLYNVKQESAPAPLTIERVSEVKTVFSSVIRLYQGTLSANDMNVCNFHLSCSRFAVNSLQHYGVVKAGLLTADRLSRCHGLPTMARHYPFDASVGKYLDPVENYTHDRLSESN